MKDLKISAPEHRMFGWNCDCQGSRKKEKRDAAAIPHSAGISTEMAEAMTRCLWFQDGWQCHHIRERHATKDLHYTYVYLQQIRIYEYRLDGVCMYYVNMFICSSYTVENRAPHPENRTEKRVLCIACHQGAAHGMKVGILCGEAYNDSNNPGSNTRHRRYQQALELRHFAICTTCKDSALLAVWTRCSTAEHSLWWQKVTSLVYLNSFSNLGLLCKI